MVPPLPLGRRDLVLVGLLLAVGTSGCARQWSRLTLARVEDATSRGELDATGTDEERWKRDRRVDIELQGAFR